MISQISKLIVPGIKWSSVSQIGRQLLQFITTVILARILSPSDFGLMGMAIIVIGLLNIFKDLGTSAAIIFQKEPSDILISSIFWLNIFFGLFVSICIFFLAPLISILFSEFRITMILKVLSISFFISSFTIPHQAILEKKLQFNKLAKVEIFSVICGSLVGISMAILGMGVWSLVFQSITISLITSIILWFITGWHPKFCFNFKEIKKISKYSSSLTGFNIFNYFVRNADNFLIGKYLGAESLGYYNLAYRIMLYPLQNISAVVARVMFPVYSELQDENDKFKATYLKIVSGIAFFTFPMMMGIIPISKSFVLSFFGNNWITTSILLVILAPVGLLQSIDSTTGSIYQAKGKTNILLYWGIFTGILAVISFIIGLKWGIIGVASSYLIINLVWFYPGLRIPFNLISLKVKELFKVLYKPLFISLFMLGALEITKYLLPDKLSDFFFFWTLVLLGIGIYLILNIIFNKEQISALKNYIIGSNIS